MRSARRLSAVGATCLLALAACKSTLRSDLSEREANQVLVALGAAAIAADKVPQSGASGRYRIEVATSASTRALAVLSAQDLPRPAPPGFEQLYAASGMWTTPAEERARHAAAVAGELAQTIERMQGVIDARVHIAQPERPSALDVRAPEPKASVLIRRLRAAPPVDEAAVRALVAGAVDGLSTERVSVVQVGAATPTALAPAFVHVGPFAVERGSASSLRAWVACALGVNLALALALVWVVRRRRA